MYLKKLLVFIIGLLFLFSGKNIVSQEMEFPEDKVHYIISAEQNGCEVTIKASIEIDDDWHINAANLPPESFSIPTDLFIDTSSNYILDDKISEPEFHHVYDEIAKEDLYLHSGQLTISRKLYVSTQSDFTVKGFFTFQTCDDNHCLPPYDGPFELAVKGCNFEEFEIPEISEENDIVIVDKRTELTKSEDVDGFENEILDTSKEEKSEKKSLLVIFFLSFLSGFAALLTPCVFPMIPMTVSFFTKQSQNKTAGIRNAILYGISIIIIYVLLGTIITAIFGASFLNSLSTNVYFNLFFFLLLVVFAISFLGAFDINLPNTWVTKADSASNRGGFLGIFFMAFTLALVSFSCTGPIVGTLLVESATIGGIGPFIGMFGFSLALALPFALFAAFPGWLNSLPKSGGWLNTVKVFLGFLELALAFKFLSNADLVVQGHFLERELFIAIWVGIFLILALYLFGFIRLPNDSPIESLSVGRTILATSVLIFVFYIFPGLWGAPLNLISGFPPPMNYSESPNGLGLAKTVTGSHSTENTHNGPQGLPVFHDLNEGLAYAQKNNKPTFLDFTGHACVNCRKMEEKVWSDIEVKSILQNDLVLISLYVEESCNFLISPTSTLINSTKFVSS